MSKRQTVYPYIGSKATGTMDGYMFCSTCGQSFEDPRQRDAHEVVCFSLGFTWTPRPQDLSRQEEKQEAQ